MSRFVPRFVYWPVRRFVRRGVVLAGLAACGLLTLLAVSRPWAHGFTTGVAARTEVTAGGRQAAPVVAGLGLVLLAAVVPLALSGRRVRGLALGISALAGVGIVAAALRVATDPVVALADLARASTGTTGSGRQVFDAGVTVWPWVAVAAGAAGVLVAVAGLGAHVSWAGGGRRYERDSDTAHGPAAANVPAPGRGDVPGSGGGQLDPLHAWQAFSRGDDPT